MGGMFSKPKVAPPPPPPIMTPPPVPEMADANAAAREESVQMAKRRGRAASILTGGNASAPMTTKTKLGA